MTLGELDCCDDDMVLERLRRAAHRAQCIVPALIGTSVATTSDIELTFSLVASAAEIASLNEEHVAEDTRALRAGDEGCPTSPDEDRLDEAQWQLFATDASTHGVRSTLTLTVLRSDSAPQLTVDLYAAAPAAFAGHHAALADVFSARGGGVVVNADLSFATLIAARGAPRRARDLIAIEVAIGHLAAMTGVDIDTAEDRLRAATNRGGTPLSELAHKIVAAQRGPDAGMRP